VRIATAATATPVAAAVGMHTCLLCAATSMAPGRQAAQEERHGSRS
jgi:hypothetical protein